MLSVGRDKRAALTSLIFLSASILAGAFQPCVAQTAVVLDRADFKGIDLDLDGVPLTPIYTDDANLFQRSTLVGDSENRIGAATSEHSLAGLNPDGVFAAELRTRVDVKNQDPTGTRQVSVGFFEGDGVIDDGQVQFPSVNDPNRIYPSFTFNSATDTGTDVRVSIEGELRQAINNGASHIKTVIQPTFPQGTSQILGVNAPIIEVTEYYDDPFDALPVFSGSTGLIYTGHAGEFVTQGETLVVGDDIARFRTFLRNDNAIDVLIDETANPGNFYSVTVRSDDGDLLQIGDSFLAERHPFQSPGVAGFDFNAKGRGLNELQAGFTIHDVAYDGTGGVERLDVSFWQNAYRSTDDTTPFGTPKAFGRLQLNVTAVPEPSGFACLAVLGIGIALRRRRDRV